MNLSNVKRVERLEAVLDPKDIPVDYSLCELVLQTGRDKENSVDDPIRTATDKGKFTLEQLVSGSNY